jgi:hypothetical protein
MKEPKNTSWEALEKAWQKQIQETNDEVPSKLWGELSARLDEKAAVPLWTRLRLSPWTWSAAAIMAIVIGLNWAITTPTQQKTLARKESQIPRMNEPAKSTVLASIKQIPLQHSERNIHLEPNQSYVPVVEPIASLPDQQPIVAQTEAKPEQSEEVWVRIDINPVEENSKPVVQAQQEAPVVTKKKTFLGRLLKQVKQVAAGEQLDWQELKEGNRTLEDGIHQVANTYYRTEQTVKQTFQIQ